ncbi:hypothetical protein [Hymenobacter volaticus]|uniref:Uncharacterized protein n=1 Tax=Hymenobacter volaticus TaxID=2932254 RepID=A0ABY4GFZ3_9BACT|nr:hypothetical protein [Hymenobacter volaticus]UOQ69728.1 hypothetical protein MUN86_29905 [Hymenobacter volaticus]
MRPALCLFFAFSLLLLVTTQSWAQARTTESSLPGYWNIETNSKTRDYTIVRFYNNQDQLVYEERLNDVCLDLSKGRRTSRQLARALQRVLRERAVYTSGTLLAQQLAAKPRFQRAFAVR